MEILKLNQVKEREFIRKIKEGAVVIYPTDTVYGIGCDALNYTAIARIRKIKQRDDKSFSIIAPDKEWIIKNFYVNKHYIERLPGPFTFILKLKKQGIVASNITNNKILGLRIPNHKFTSKLQKAGIPFVTTSVNISGQQPVNSIEEIPHEILKNVDIVIDDGKIENNPSTIIDLTGKIARIVRR
ncbi:threonylcarbamoyl-AMP synthase [Candidatus Woesearchaeota archaeon]|nr:threonylcarbamoyl-AMP synthase [Candidatus Woesearchaeota archaeon]